MKRSLMIMVMLFLITPYAKADDGPNFAVESEWLTCAKRLDCVAVEDGFCHTGRAVNAAHINAWNVKNRETTELLTAEDASEFCLKPEMASSLSFKQGYADCQGGNCVFKPFRAATAAPTQGSH